MSSAQPRSYPAFDQKLKELCALPLMHGIWAARVDMTADQLKRLLRSVTANGDRILVVEAKGEWASRRAENNLGDLIPPRGDGLSRNKLNHQPAWTFKEERYLGWP